MNNCLKHRYLVKLPLYTRSYASAQENRKPVGLTQPPDPESASCDYIGPPDPQSNLRPYVRHYNKNETELAKNLRLKRLEVDNWNNEFWTKHNKRFYEEKADFIRLNNVAGTSTEDITADRMSVFYKSFLDKNRRMHIMYNISWYLKNFDILTMSFQVYVQNLIRRAKRQTT